MTINKFAAVAIAVSLLAGTTGCAMMSPVASRIEYAPSDGSQVNLENLKLRNFIYFNTGKVSALAGSIVNSGLETSTLKISYLDSLVNEQKEISISVNAGQKLDLGFNGTKALTLNLGGEPGGSVSFNVSEGSASQVINVPVMDDTFDIYKPIIDSLNTAE